MAHNKNIKLAEKLEQYCDYGNAPGLNELLREAANYLRNTQYIENSDDIIKHTSHVTYLDDE